MVKTIREYQRDGHYIGHSEYQRHESNAGLGARAYRRLKAKIARMAKAKERHRGKPGK